MKKWQIIAPIGIAAAAAAAVLAMPKNPKAAADADGAPVAGAAGITRVDGHAGVAAFPAGLPPARPPEGGVVVLFYTSDAAPE